MDWYDELHGEIMRVVVALRMPVRAPSCRTCPMKSAPSLRLFTVIALEKPRDTEFMILETPMLLRRMVGDFAHQAKEQVCYGREPTSGHRTKNGHPPISE